MNLVELVQIGVIGFSLLLASQGIFTLVWMLYTWENPDKASQRRSPTSTAEPRFGFSILIPARHEEKVIADTIRSVASLNYPKSLFEVLVLCRADDEVTIGKAQETILGLENEQVKLVVFNDLPINKPHCLNIGLGKASFEYVTIFDAEDQPHADILNVINTLLINSGADIVQSGVQLMNFRSHWFSALNVLEYFFWFKSGLHFFLNLGQVLPLAGNTVFFRKEKLVAAGGWDENCLTEDADIGIRMSLLGAKMRVVYDEMHTTREETPDSVNAFIKQRTRWNQGFLQILAKGDWAHLPKMRQKIFAAYILLSPLLNTLLLLCTPIGIWIALNLKLPVVVSIFSFLPIYIFSLQVLVYVVGQWEFARIYHLPHPPWLALKLLATFLPYQMILTMASVRAVARQIVGINKWEKTNHANAHRIAYAAV